MEDGGVKRFSCWLLLAACLTLCCAPAARKDEASRPHVFVSILPQAYVVERVGGQLVDVDVLVGPGQSPATYEPTPKQMAALSESSAYFRIGVPFEEALLAKLQRSCPDLNVVDTRKGIELRPMVAEGHGAKDPHVWLDPRLVKEQARNIAAELERLDPWHAAEYRGNLRAFEEDLDALDRRIAAMLEPLKNRPFLVFHPSYGYFANAYGLKQVAVETEGKEPGVKRLGELIQLAKRERVTTIFVQPEFSSTNAEVIAEAIGGKVVPLDPLARDYMVNLEQMARRIRDALEPESR
jgi:zinc transport system substrate-binding protein